MTKKGFLVVSIPDHVADEPDAALASRHILLVQVCEHNLEHNLCSVCVRVCI